MIAVVFLLIFFNIGGSLLTNIIGFGFPAYASLRAIESSSKADDTQWYVSSLLFLPFSESLCELFEKHLFERSFYSKVNVLVRFWFPQCGGGVFGSDFEMVSILLFVRAFQWFVT